MKRHIASILFLFLLSVYQSAAQTYSVKRLGIEQGPVSYTHLFRWRQGEKFISTLLEIDTFITILFLVTAFIRIITNLIIGNKCTIWSHNITNSRFTIIIFPTAQIIQTVIFQRQFQAAFFTNSVAKFSAGSRRRS